MAPALQALAELAKMPSLLKVVTMVFLSIPSRPLTRLN